MGLCVVSLIISAMSFGNWSGWSTDCFSFLHHARSLAETGHFDSVRLNTPPGYPVVLAPIVLLFGDLPTLSLRALSAIVLAAIAVATFRLNVSRLGLREAWLAGLLAACSPVLLQLSTTPLSELVFTALLCLLLIRGEQWRRNGVTGVLQLLFSGLLLAGLVLIRSMGIVLLPCLALAILRSRSLNLRKRIQYALVLTAATVLPLIAWEIRQSQFPESFGYSTAWMHAREAEASTATGIALQAQRLAVFGPLRLTGLMELLFSREACWRLYSPRLITVSSFIIGGSICLIAGIVFLQTRSPVDAYVLLTTAMLSLWPYDEGVRFVMPLFPIVIGYPFILLSWVRKRWAKVPMLGPFPRIALACWMVSYFAGTVQWFVRLPAIQEKQIAFACQMNEFAAWQRKNLPGTGCFALIPEGDNSKLLLAGSSYLSRLPIHYVDQLPGKPLAANLQNAEVALVHCSLSGEAEQTTRLRRTGRVGPFALMRAGPSTGQTSVTDAGRFIPSP